MIYPDWIATTWDGNPHAWELEALCQIISDAHCRTVFEFGTFNGSTAIALSRLPEIEIVWTLDIPTDMTPALSILESDRQYMNVEKLPLPDNVVQLWGDSAAFDFNPFYRACDGVFVMGAHSLPYIRNDLNHALRMVTSGGVVVLHAGTPSPLADLEREYRLVVKGDRMAVVLGVNR